MALGQSNITAEADYCSKPTWRRHICITLVVPIRYFICYELRIVALRVFKFWWTDAADRIIRITPVAKHFLECDIYNYKY